MRILILATIALLMAVDTQAKAGSDTMRIAFAFNVDALSEKEQVHLDALIAGGRLQPNRNVKIIGYCDYVGGEGYNAELSRHRANAVRRYLMASGFSPDKIILCVGKGKIHRRNISANNGYAPDRRVDIVVGGVIAPIAVVEKKPTSMQAKAAGKPLSDVKSLNDLDTGQTLLLDNMIFQPGRHFLLPSSMPTLEKLYALLAKDANIKVRLEGHICCFMDVYKGDVADHDAGDMQLSVNRAKYIYDYLIEHGISKDRLTYAGYGNARPLRQETKWNPDDRRVEVRITGK